MSKISCSHVFLQVEKQNIQSAIIEKLGIKWDYADSTGQGGSTTTGNVARRLLFKSENRRIITDLIQSVSDREVAERIAVLLSTILRALSSDRKVNVDEYKKLCTELNLLLLREVSWVSITPSLHKVLAHSWELIEVNDGRGLKNLSEEGFEATNKRLRLYRIKLSRKNNQINNLTDCFKRLWVKSDGACARRA